MYDWEIFSIICLALISLGLVACGVAGEEKVIDLANVLEINEYTNVLNEHKNIPSGILMGLRQSFISLGGIIGVLIGGIIYSYNSEISL